MSTLNAKAFANALTVVTAVFYIVCAALSYMAPDLIFSIARSWMHTVNMESIRAEFTPDLGTLLFGLTTIAVITWVTTYATIALYNKWAKGKQMRYLLTGLLAGTALLLFYLIVMGLASGSWDYTVRQLVSLRYFVGALILGFSIQTGLFCYLKDCHRIGRVEKGSVSASMASSSVAMLACCAHHLTDLLPFLGLSVLSLALAKYQTWFLSLGIVSNAVGIYLMINSIRRTKI